MGWKSIDIGKALMNLRLSFYISFILNSLIYAGVFCAMEFAGEKHLLKWQIRPAKINR